MTDHYRKPALAATCGCLAVLLLTTSCAPKTPPDTRAADEKTIRDFDAQFASEAKARDLEGTLVYYADDATLMPPNAPAAVGKAAIRPVWVSLLSPEVTVTWQVTKVDVARSGELGYVIGTYEVTGKDPSMNDHGKLLEVWKKQPNENWRVVADIYNSDLPAAPAPSAKKK